MEGKARLGETIDIVDAGEMAGARRLFARITDPRSRLDFRQRRAIDIAFFTRRLQQAQQWRDWLAERDGLDSYRLIAGESDGLPGVTIDRFGNFLVLQLLSAGAEYQRAAMISRCRRCSRNAPFTIAAMLRCVKKKAGARAGAGCG
jgi:23S rRNA (cytosine1962-C5)-methyltransferase